jgi:hypothetical protein
MQNPFHSPFAENSDPDEGVVWAASEVFLKSNRKEYDSLRTLVNEHLVEGSNPRGEISVVRNAQAITLLDWDTSLKDPTKPGQSVRLKPFITFEALSQGFVWANTARLKTHPGSEKERAPILKADLLPVDVREGVVGQRFGYAALDQIGRRVHSGGT